MGRIPVRLRLSFLFLFAIVCGTEALGDNFSYSNFDSVSGLTLNGATAQNGSLLTLTPDQTYQTGSAWYSQQQTVVDGFTTTFQFQIIHGTSQYADGIWFYVQNNSLSDGSVLYTPAVNSLAVEFDDFQNTWDPNANHVAFLSCGSSTNPPAVITDHTNGCTLAINSNLPVMFSDGAVHMATVTYTPGELALSVDGNLALTSEVDLGSLLNLNDGNAWVGFRTTTGAFSEENDVLSWSFQSATVPEPSSIATLAVGLVFLLKSKRRQQSS